MYIYSDEPINQYKFRQGNCGSEGHRYFRRRVVGTSTRQQ